MFRKLTALLILFISGVLVGVGLVVAEIREYVTNGREGMLEEMLETEGTEITVEVEEKEE